jgi:hypothetical protein
VLLPTPRREAVVGLASEDILQKVRVQYSSLLHIDWLVQVSPTHWFCGMEPFFRESVIVNPINLGMLGVDISSEATRWFRLTVT